MSDTANHKPIPEKFDHQAFETVWKNYWQQQGTYCFDINSHKQTFSIDSPPPTVSGSLHVGHVFSYTHQDLLARYKRMCGYNVFYPMGYDDNGLPTERRVQQYFNIRCNPLLSYDATWVAKQADKKPGPAEEVSRRNFIETCGSMTALDEAAFQDMWQTLGLSIDWTQQYATIDTHCRTISQLSFLELAHQQQAYLNECPTMWDVDFRTAVAQAEVEDRKMPGLMHDIRFAVEGGGEFVISTSRPEMLAACIAVVAHPDDARYQHLFGKRAITPLFAASVPIMPSTHADPEKGSGILMVCTFGDAADVAWWSQSGLPIKQIIGYDGKLLPIDFHAPLFHSQQPDAAQAAYSQLVGCYVREARKRMVPLLQEALIGEPRPIEQAVKFYEKGDRPLEWIPTRQWFIRLLDKKDILLAQGDAIVWHPSFMKARYDNWVQGLNQDWCISRQRYFGVPFPVWYPLQSNGEIDYAHPIYADKSALPVDPMTDTPQGYTEAQRGVPHGFVGNPDVMDTWATSAMTPQIASHWQLDDARHHKLFPMDVRPQSHEIIRTWAFYSIVKAWLHHGSIPWRHVMISGWILDPDRKKMSKSQGNVVTPTAILNDYSVDAVRYWAARARLGADTAYDPNVFKIGRRLTIKLFNASRFVIAQLDNSGLATRLDTQLITEAIDCSYVAMLHNVCHAATVACEAFDYASALEHIETAFWDFCDNYLEIVKIRSYGDTATAQRQSVLATLSYALSVFLRLFAPFMPYITEEVWSWRYAAWYGQPSIHQAMWPHGDSMAPSIHYQTICRVIADVRSAKAEAGVGMRHPVARLVVQSNDTSVLDAIRVCQADLLSVAALSDNHLMLQHDQHMAYKSDIVLATEDKSLTLL